MTPAKVTRRPPQPFRPEPSQVREHVRGLIMDTPGGLVRYDPTNVHCWRVVRIARVVDKGQFHVVWSSELPLRPELAK